MRTTVTLDADVAKLLRNAMRERRRSFQETLNQAIRAGLSGSDEYPAEEDPDVIRARRMGLRTGIDPGRLGPLADELEAESFLELNRVPRRRKATPARAHK